MGRMRGPSKSHAVLSRRQKAADLYLQGHTMAQISDQLNVAVGTVHNDLKRVREAWRESSVRDFDELRTIELLKIERIEQEAWAGWGRSQQPQQTATIKGEGGPSQKASKTMKTRVGDPRFLDVLARCSAQRRQLMGLDLPIATTPPTPADAGSPLPSIDDQRGQLLAMIESMRERSRHADAAKLLEDHVIDVAVSQPIDEQPSQGVLSE